MPAVFSNLKRIIAKGFAEVNFLLIFGFTGVCKEIALYRKHQGTNHSQLLGKSVEVVEGLQEYVRRNVEFLEKKRFEESIACRGYT